MFNSFIIQRKFKNMRLDQILTETVKFVKTKQRAVALIMSGNVFLGEKKIDKPGKIMKQNQIIRIKDNNNPWVSRGGIKLQKAISFFGVNVEDKICLDIGCSTGGFTEVLFKKKAKKIYAVDVGYGLKITAMFFCYRLIDFRLLLTSGIFKNCSKSDSFKILTKADMRKHGKYPENIINEQ